MLAFAEKAYRRPLNGGRSRRATDLYRKLRSEELPHDDAWRLMLARVLVSPAFLYRVETAGPGRRRPVSDWELASRLSYFLWSSAPDDTLRRLAAAGTLCAIPTCSRPRPAACSRTTRSAASPPSSPASGCTSTTSTTLDEKSERHFPTFNGLRGAMYEETVRFFTDLFQRDGSVLAFLDADHTLLNEPLAKHYGIPGVSGHDWRRVDGVKAQAAAASSGLARPWRSSPAHRARARSSGATGSPRSCSARSCRSPPGRAAIARERSSTPAA